MADYNINAITRRVVYTGSAGLGPYAFSFEIIAQADVGVYFNQTALTLSSDYTVTINANGTGSVTIITGGNVPSTPTANDTIIIIGARDIERTTDFVTAGDLLASSLNEQLDSNIIFEQQIDERVDRSIKFPVYDSFTGDNVLPAAATRADKILKFDTAGNIGVETASALFAGAVVGANFTNNTFTGNGSQTAFTTTVEAGSKNNAQVYIDGVYQLKSSFSVSGTTLTFTEAPPLNAQVEVIIGNAIDTLDADSGNINYNQGGTGAQTRTVENKLQEFVSVKDFGAIGDGVADDTAAIQAALTAAVVAGKSLFVPAGTYYVSSQITASTSTNACSIVGEGPSNTRLVWTSGAGGLSITYSDTIRPPFISDLSLLTGTSGSGTALTITGPDSVSVIQYGPIVQRLQIQGGDLASDCWDTGINFVKCWYPKVEDVNINGLNEYGPTFVSSAGIKLTSCQVCYFNNFNIFHVTDAILEVAGAGGSIQHGEGFTFCNFEIVGVGTGISLRAEQTAPGTNIGPGHINAFNYGIRLKFQFQTSVHNMLIYKTDDLTGTPQSFVGIELEDCRSNKVHDNLIHGFKAADLVGISMTGGVSALTDFNHVHDNLFYEFTNSAGNKIGLLIGAGTGNCLFHHNYADSTVSTPILLSAGIELTNKFDSNYPVIDQTFADGDATPSVANAISGLFLTANTGATTITAFDDGYNGQEITIFANDANTIIQHGSNIILAGGVNFVMSAGDILRLRAIGSTTVFREISRTEV